MSKLVRKAVNLGAPLRGGTLSARFTGIRHRANPATGDLGPDAPESPQDGGRRRRGPRGGNRRLGGDVQSPLS